jgi:[acyl-carrier-protein] S-malonyltransferase
MNLGMVVPGYGSQYIGMGKDLYDNSRLVQEYFEEASSCLNLNFVKLCFASSEQELNKIENAYPTIFLLTACGLGLVKELGITPQIVAGHGIVGFYSALYAAGALNFVDTLYLLKKLAAFYQEFLQTHTFSGLRTEGISYRLIAAQCKDLLEEEQLFVAIREPQNHCVLIGTPDAVQESKRRLTQYSNTPLKIGGVESGLYSSFAQDLAQHFGVYREKVDFKDTIIPILRNDTGLGVTNAEILKRLSKEQLCKPLRWDKVMETVSATCTHLIIPTAAPNFCAMISKFHPDKTVQIVDSMATLDYLKRSF